MCIRDRDYIARDALTSTQGQQEEAVAHACREFVLDARQSALQQIQWSWTVQGQPPVLQGVAVAAAVLSAMIVWCNVTVGISRSLSPLYHLIAWSEHEFFSQVRSDPVIACSIQLTSSSVPNGCQLHVRSCLVACGLPLHCLLYTSPSPRDATLSRMPSSA